jgi:hypothetical protein
LRDSFRAYYRPSGQNLADIWEEGIIVLDTNTLLNFFRYTPSTRDEFLGVLEKLSESLWIPHHVGLEFQRRRLGVISTTSEAFTKVTDALGRAKGDIGTTLNEFKHHPSLNRGDIKQEVGNFIDALSEKLQKQKEEHLTRLVTDGDADSTFERITDLFDGRVGAAFSADEISVLEVEGKERYEKKVPPGFKDKSDSNPNQYGDLIIWKEILRLGAERKLPVIFVTDDAKEDWWWKHGGETQGPRVELVEEYWAVAERRIHFYEPLRFLEYAKQQTNTTVSRQSLEEVEEVSSSYGIAQRVLQDRRDDLQVEQTRMMQRQMSARASNGLSPAKRADIHAELRRVVEQHQAAEAQLAFMAHQMASTEKTVATQNPSDSSDLREHLADLSMVRADLDKDVWTLDRHRSALELELTRTADRDEKMNRHWERRLQRLQEELEEVNRALEELNE